MCWTLIKFTKCQDATLGAGHGATFRRKWRGVTSVWCEGHRGQNRNKNIWHLSRLAWDLGRTVYKSLYYSPIKTEIYGPKCALFKHYTFIKYGNLWRENSNDLTLNPLLLIAACVFLGHALSVGWHCILYFKIGTCLKKRIHQNQYWQSRGWHPMFMPRPSPGFSSTGPGPRLENEYISQWHKLRSWRWVTNMKLCKWCERPWGT